MTTITAYEQQTLNTERFYDEAIQLAEADGDEILHSFVPEDHVHELINNTVDEGIDEG
ncbi:MAG: hypothetical protein OQL19_11785 [Gammaproteobacteria bacterium]|nr:hypothetical protein [Gammaproteobacteria bacterium]